MKRRPQASWPALLLALLLIARPAAADLPPPADAFPEDAPLALHVPRLGGLLADLDGLLGLLGELDDALRDLPPAALLPAVLWNVRGPVEATGYQREHGLDLEGSALVSLGPDLETALFALPLLDAERFRAWLSAVRAPTRGRARLHGETVEILAPDSELPLGCVIREREALCQLGAPREGGVAPLERRVRVRPDRGGRTAAPPSVWRALPQRGRWSVVVRPVPLARALARHWGRSMKRAHRLHSPEVRAEVARQAERIELSVIKQLRDIDIVAAAAVASTAAALAGAGERRGPWVPGGHEARLEVVVQMTAAGARRLDRWLPSPRANAVQPSTAKLGATPRSAVQPTSVKPLNPEATTPASRRVVDTPLSTPEDAEEDEEESREPPAQSPAWGRILRWSSTPALINLFLRTDPRLIQMLGDWVGVALPVEDLDGTLGLLTLGVDVHCPQARAARDGALDLAFLFPSAVVLGLRDARASENVHQRLRAGLGARPLEPRLSSSLGIGLAQPFSPGLGPGSGDRPAVDPRIPGKPEGFSRATFLAEVAGGRVEIHVLERLLLVGSGPMSGYAALRRLRALGRAPDAPPSDFLRMSVDFGAVDAALAASVISRDHRSELRWVEHFRLRLSPLFHQLRRLKVRGAREADGRTLRFVLSVSP